jgi:hypothetical protein
MSNELKNEPVKTSRTEGFVQKVMASIVSRAIWEAIEHLSESE